MIQKILDEFVKRTRIIIKDNLIAIYLHGSLTMGCFNPSSSDIDLMVIIKEDMDTITKRTFMDMVITLNEKAPSKGLELSIVKKMYCSPFKYPTPYELHFSKIHLNWYLEKPDEYVEKMHGVDKDLGAHFMIIKHRGICLFDKEIKEIVGDVSKEDYFDSIKYDIENAREEVLTNPVYIILNLCRVLANKKKALFYLNKKAVCGN